MSSQQPTANTMNVEAAQPEQRSEQHEQQNEVMRLRGGGNTVADCLA
jgi:hypothetical protein